MACGAEFRKNAELLRAPECKANLSVLALTARRWRSEAASAGVRRRILRADSKQEFESHQEEVRHC